VNTEKRTVTSLSLPNELMERIDRVVDIASKNKHSVGRVTRSSVLRFALERGLEQIEQEQANG
jgi:metal-responsive CopG/Arc/MetJ family transcriptional regulator